MVGYYGQNASDDVKTVVQLYKMSDFLSWDSKSKKVVPTPGGPVGVNPTSTVIGDYYCTDAALLFNNYTFGSVGTSYGLLIPKADTDDSAALALLPLEYSKKNTRWELGSEKTVTPDNNDFHQSYAVFETNAYTEDKTYQARVWEGGHGGIISSEIKSVAAEKDFYVSPDDVTPVVGIILGLPPLSDYLWWKYTQPSIMWKFVQRSGLTIGNTSKTSEKESTSKKTQQEFSIEAKVTSPGGFYVGVKSGYKDSTTTTEKSTITKAISSKQSINIESTSANPQVGYLVTLVSSLSVGYVYVKPKGTEEYFIFGDWSGRFAVRNPVACNENYYEMIPFDMEHPAKDTFNTKFDFDRVMTGFPTLSTGKGDKKKVLATNDPESYINWLKSDNTLATGLRSVAFKKNTRSLHFGANTKLNGTYSFSTENEDETSQMHSWSTGVTVGFESKGVLKEYTFGKKLEAIYSYSSELTKTCSILTGTQFDWIIDYNIPLTGTRTVLNGDMNLVFPLSSSSTPWITDGMAKLNFSPWLLYYDIRDYEPTKDLFGNRLPVPTILNNQDIPQVGQTVQVGTGQSNTYTVNAAQPLIDLGPLESFPIFVKLKPGGAQDKFTSSFILALQAGKKADNTPKIEFITKTEFSDSPPKDSDDFLVSSFMSDGGSDNTNLISFVNSGPTPIQLFYKNDDMAALYKEILYDLKPDKFTRYSAFKHKKVKSIVYTAGKWFVGTSTGLYSGKSLKDVSKLKTKFDDISKLSLSMSGSELNISYSNKNEAAESYFAGVDPRVSPHPDWAKHLAGSIQGDPIEIEKMQIHSIWPTLFILKEKEDDETCHLYFTYDNNQISKEDNNIILKKSIEKGQTLDDLTNLINADVGPVMLSDLTLETGSIVSGGALDDGTKHQWKGRVALPPKGGLAGTLYVNAYSVTNDSFIVQCQTVYGPTKKDDDSTSTLFFSPSTIKNLIVYNEIKLPAQNGNHVFPNIDSMYKIYVDSMWYMLLVVLGLGHI